MFNVMFNDFKMLGTFLWRLHQVMQKLLRLTAYWFKYLYLYLHLGLKASNTSGRGLNRSEMPIKKIIIKTTIKTTVNMN